MLLRLLIFALVLMITTPIFSQTSMIEPGVSQALAKWRGANYSDVRYKLNITLEKGAPLMSGDIEIRVKLTDEGARKDLILDWRTTSFANDKDKPYANVVAVNDAPDILHSIANEHITISKDLLKPGENVIKINFASPIKTSGAAVTRYVDKEDGAEYIYSLFVPSDASTAFPVFDQPDLKARFSLRIDAPSDWKVVSNSNLKVNASITDKEQKLSGKTVWFFLETKPISSYVFAFAAGDFAEFAQRETGEAINLNEIDADLRKNNRYVTDEDFRAKAGKLIPNSKIYVRKSQAEKFKQHAEEVFRLNREGVKFLEDWFDYKFPFPKYDLVLIPEFPFGGMEHAGATFLREDRIIFPTEPTKNDFITRANLIFHEAAHQWFGDTVTMKWFDDLWLKEGFAEFMAYKTLEKVLPEYNAWKIFYERNKQAAYLTDVTRGTTPIYQEIPNLSSAKSAYGNIVYRKAPSFLRQAEFYLGEDKFQTAVRAFLKKHEFANAEWTDLVKEFETASGKNLKIWGESWVKQRGLPIFMMEVINPKPKINLTNNLIDIKLVFSQTNALKEKSSWAEKLQFFYIYNNGKRRVETVDFGKDDKVIEETWGINFRGAESKEAKRDLQPPKFIFPNYQDYGYGIFLLDEKSRAYVLENIQTEKDDFLRSMMWGSLWDSVRFYELAPEDYVELVIENLELSNRKRIPTSVDPRLDPKYVETFPETDESTISTLLNRVGTVMSYYLNDEQREKFAPRLEKALIEKMTLPWIPQGEKITAFRAFTNLASTTESRQMLKSLLNPEKGKAIKSEWEKSRSLPPLKAKDRFDIVTRLLILGDEDAPQFLAELEKIETGDAAKRYAYAAKAGIATAENKAKYWKDFISNRELSESYIESAFNVWNTPKHAELTLPYLGKALAELPNLKKNRKIFFVNGWLGAFIGGQKSAEALNTINKFLTDNPNLDRDLRLKILENADALERAVKIRAKFAK